MYVFILLFKCIYIVKVNVNLLSKCIFFIGNDIESYMVMGEDIIFFIGR